MIIILFYRLAYKVVDHYNLRRIWMVDQYLNKNAFLAINDQVINVFARLKRVSNESSLN